MIFLLLCIFAHKLEAQCTKDSFENAIAPFWQKQSFDLNKYLENKTDFYFYKQIDDNSKSDVQFISFDFHRFPSVSVEDLKVQMRLDKEEVQEASAIIALSQQFKTNDFLNKVSSYKYTGNKSQTDRFANFKPLYCKLLNNYTFYRFVIERLDFISANYFPSKDQPARFHCVLNSDFDLISISPEYKVLPKWDIRKLPFSQRLAAYSRLAHFLHLAQLYGLNVCAFNFENLRLLSVADAFVWWPSFAKYVFPAEFECEPTTSTYLAYIPEKIMHYFDKRFGFGMLSNMAYKLGLEILDYELGDKYKELVLTGNYNYNACINAEQGKLEKKKFEEFFTGHNTYAKKLLNQKLNAEEKKFEGNYQEFIEVLMKMLSYKIDGRYSLEKIAQSFNEIAAKNKEQEEGAEPKGYMQLFKAKIQI